MEVGSVVKMKTKKEEFYGVIVGESGDKKMFVVIFWYENVRRYLRLPIGKASPKLEAVEETPEEMQRVNESEGGFQRSYTEAMIEIALMTKDEKLFLEVSRKKKQKNI